MQTRPWLKFTTLTLIGIGALAAGTRAAVPQSPPDLAALSARVEAAVLAEDSAALKDARLGCLRLLATPGAPANRAALLRYTIAYAGWRLAFMPTVAKKEQGDLLADAKTQLDTVIAADGRNA